MNQRQLILLLHLLFCFFNSSFVQKIIDQVSVYLFGALTHDDTASLIVQHGSVCLAHHLEDIIYGIVHISEIK